MTENKLVVFMASLSVAQYLFLLLLSASVVLEAAASLSWTLTGDESFHRPVHCGLHRRVGARLRTILHEEQGRRVIVCRRLSNLPRRRREVEPALDLEMRRQLRVGRGSCIGQEPRTTLGHGP